MYKFKFVPTESLASDLFVLANSKTAPEKSDYETIAKKHGLEIFAHEGKMTLGFEEDLKHQIIGVAEAGYIQTEIPA